MVQVKDSVSTVQGVNWQRLEQSRQKQSQSLAQSRTSKVGLPFRCDCDEMTRDPSKSVKLIGTYSSGVRLNVTSESTFALESHS